MFVSLLKTLEIYIVNRDVFINYKIVKLMIKYYWQSYVNEVILKSPNLFYIVNHNCLFSIFNKKEKEKNIIALKNIFIL